MSAPETPPPHRDLPLLAPPPDRYDSRALPAASVTGLIAFIVGAGLMAGVFLAMRGIVRTSAPAHFSQAIPTDAAVYIRVAIDRLVVLLLFILMTLAGWAVAGRGGQLFHAGLRRHHDAISAVLGLVAFGGGIILVVMVFSSAAQAFAMGSGGVPLPRNNVPPDYIDWTVEELYRILLLAVMALDGSLLAGRGVGLVLDPMRSRRIVH